MTATWVEVPLDTADAPPLDVLRQALAGRALGSHVSRNELGAELLAGGVTPSQMGATFRAGMYAGLLVQAGYVTARHGEARGRVVRVYAVVGR